MCCIRSHSRKGEHWRKVRCCHTLCCPSKCPTPLRIHRIKPPCRVCRALAYLFHDPAKTSSSLFGKLTDIRENGAWSPEDVRVFRDAKRELVRLVDTEGAILSTKPGERGRILRLPLAVREQAKPVLVGEGAVLLEDRRFNALVSRCDDRNLAIWIQEEDTEPDWCAPLYFNDNRSILPLA